MTAIWDNAKLKVFVKNTLGCGCPDKVFEKIDVSRHSIEDDETEATRIVVGDTLLIYVIRPGLAGKLIDGVESIGLAGKDDRDTNNYNRFRLVVSSFDDISQQGKVSARFSKAFNTDEKMHIHFVNQELIAGL